MGSCITKKNKIADINSHTISSSNFFTEKCLICWENLPRHVFIPCGHFGVCTECKNKINTSRIIKGCPVCNNSESILFELFFCGKEYDKNDENIIFLICKLKKEMEILNKKLINEKNLNIEMRKRVELMNSFKIKLNE